MNVMFLIALSVVLLLTVVAIYYHWRLFKLKKRQDRQRREIALKQEKQRQFANDSIQIICRTLLQKQVGPAEASLRICGLLDSLQIPLEQRMEPDIVAFAKMADAIRHIPILDDWKALPRSQKLEYQKVIEKHEREMEDFICSSAEKLLGRSF